MSSEYEILRQREDRMHRMGQKGPPPHIVYIDVETVDARIQALIAGKQFAFDSLPDLAEELAKHFPEPPYTRWIGFRVSKKRRKGKEPKPFKSGSKINTVRGVIEHPIIGGPAFTFNEDDSYVTAKICELVDEVCVCEFDPYDDGDTEESWHYKRTCLHCGHSWFGLHCIHDGHQNPCPGCDVRPTPIPETA